MTKHFNWINGIDINELNMCADIIRNKGTVVFPTETVYGIGANAKEEEAVKKIYEAKGRASDNPLIVHISDKEQIDELCIIENDIEKSLINEFMPGPFTLVLKKKPIIPNIVSANLDTVGIRMPTNKIANNFIKACKVPIAAPSANISGKPSGTNVKDIENELDGKVDAFIDGGSSDIGLESTVVRVIDNIPVILRPGRITAEEIKQVIGCVKINDKVLGKVEKGEKVESPGMKYRHYAPNTKCILVDIEDEELKIKRIKEIIKQNPNSCVLGFLEHKNKINSKEYISLGKQDDLEEISRNIYTELRKVDNYDVDLVIIEAVPKKRYRASYNE